MKKLILNCLLLVQTSLLLGTDNLYNQTPTTTPILPPTTLPFTLSIDQMNLNLPNGWHSGAVATWGNKCLLLAGRTNGLHGFDSGNNNFPPRAQNLSIYVIDFKKMRVYQRALNDPASGLTQQQIDTLSVTSPQSYQSGRTLYITGGYGVDSATGQMGTKPTLTAIDIPGLIHWVTHPDSSGTAAKQIRQTTDPLVQVTGGYMAQVSPHTPTLLIFGQNFTGFYSDSSNGDYTQQVRAFTILDNGQTLHVLANPNQPPQNPSYRRRDLNVVPILSPGKNGPIESFVALSGVFTLNEGIWTVPVLIASDGSSSMADPNDPNTFKQGMNNYASANIGLYSEDTEEMYIIIPGGLTYGYFDNGVFLTDSEIPFTNEVTTVKIDPNGNFSQYIMDAQYPTILSTFSNPGNTLLFGAGATFIPAQGLPLYRNEVIGLDNLPSGPTVIGYIVGGIQSTLPNTSTRADSAASPYIFQVTLTPR